MFLKTAPKHGYELIPDVYFFVIYLPFRINIFYRYLKVALTVNAINQILDIYIWCSSDSPAIAYLDHGLVPIMVAYESACILLLLHIKKRLLVTLDILKELQWPLNNITKTTKNIILIQALRIKIAFYVTCFLAFLYICFMYPEIFNMLIIRYLMDHAPISLTICVILLYAIHMMLMILCVVQLPFVLIYLSHEWIIQIDLLLEFTRYISKENENLLIQRDNRYQSMITKRLRKIIIRQNELARPHFGHLKMVSSVSLASITVGFIYTTFMVFATVKGFLPKRILIIHFVTFTWVYTYISYIGQLYENKWSAFYKLICSLPWYDFNIANRKTYLLILTGSTKDITLAVWNSLNLNYVLYLKVWRTLYTCANALFNVNRKK